ncbi:WD40-repeat-containing domain protein [Pelagophyceae sp. CCMP2097]|nr:WD40-repeat-containing domain protein [Pelagophyceae sp. CCMP2097]
MKKLGQKAMKDGAAAMERGSKVVASAAQEALHKFNSDAGSSDGSETLQTADDGGATTPRWAHACGFKLLIRGDVDEAGLSPEGESNMGDFRQRADLIAAVVSFLNPRSIARCAQLARNWADVSYAQPLYYDLVQLGLPHLTVIGRDRRIDALCAHAGAILSSSERRVLAWDLATGALAAETAVCDTCEITRLLISHGQLWSASANGAMREWSLPHNVKNVEFRTQLWDHNAQVNDVCTTLNAPFFGQISSVSPKVQAPRLVSACDDRTVRVWDVETKKAEAVLRPHNHQSATMRSVFVSTDHLFIGTSDGTVYVHAFDGASRSQTRDKKKQNGVEAIYPLEAELRCGDTVISAIRTASARPDGRHDALYVASWDGSLRVWRIPMRGLDFELVHTFAQHKGRITSLLITKQHFITGADDSTLRVYGLYHGTDYYDALERVVHLEARCKALEVAPPTEAHGAFLCCGRVHSCRRLPPLTLTRRLTNGNIVVLHFGASL